MNFSNHCHQQTVSMLCGMIAIFCTPACALRSETQSAKPMTLVGSSPLRLLRADETKEQTVQALVALHATSDEGTIANEPFCGGIVLSPFHILTPAHCVQVIPNTIALKKSYVACGKKRDILVTGSERTLGDRKIRLTRVAYEGESCAAEIPSTDEQTSDGLSIPNLTQPTIVAQDLRLDFAILKLDRGYSGASLSLSDNASSASKTVLFAFPYGIPLTASNLCSASASQESGFVTHDCSTLPGSSGGILVDESSKLPVGMHVRGNGINLYDFYLQHQRFESPTESISNLCSLMGISFPQLEGDCSLNAAGNRAVTFASIKERLSVHWPQLLQEIHRSR